MLRESRIASIFLISRTNSIGESYSASFQMDVMMMLLMGGMPLSGGMKTKVSCAVCGCLMLNSILFKDTL